MPGTIWSTLHVSVHFILITTPETSTIIIPILQAKQLGHRWLTNKPKVTVCKWQSYTL